MPTLCQLAFTNGGQLSRNRLQYHKNITSYDIDIVIMMTCGCLPGLLDACLCFHLNVAMAVSRLRVGRNCPVCWLPDVRRTCPGTCCSTVVEMNIIQSYLIVHCRRCMMLYFNYNTFTQLARL